MKKNYYYLLAFILTAILSTHVLRFLDTCVFIHRWKEPYAIVHAAVTLVCVVIVTCTCLILHKLNKR